MVSDPRPLVYSRKCGTCIFRPGNRLRPGRLADVIRKNRENGTVLMCHETTYGQAETEVACRGFMDAYGPETNTVRVMERLAALHGYAEGFREVDPR